MDNLSTYLEDIIEDQKLPQPVRDLAQDTLTQWNDGIIPNQKTLKRLSVATAPPPPCSRIKHDGSCEWLRKYGKAYNLPVAPIGEKAICCFGKKIMHKCQGYRKLR